MPATGQRICRNCGRRFAATERTCPHDGGVLDLDESGTQLLSSTSDQPVRRVPSLPSEDRGSTAVLPARSEGTAVLPRAPSDSERKRRTPAKAPPPAPPSAGFKLEPGDVVADRFVIEQLLGSGGFGSTFVCQDEKFLRRAVVKVLHPRYADDEDVRRRFDLEALSLSRLHHPNIVQVFDRGVSDDGVPWFAMEWVQGKTLSSLVAPGQALPEDQVREIGAQLCDALEAVHAEGFVHRDLKPDNILLASDKSGRPLLKLLDFGIAAVAQQNAADSAVRNLQSVAIGNIIGTMQYLSPEQARGEHVTPSSDIYAAGVLLYLLATGRLPVEPPPNWTLLSINAYVNEKAPPPEKFRPEVSKKLSAIMMRAIEKDAAKRWPSAAALGTALKEGPRATSIGGSSTMILPAAAQPGTAVLRTTEVASGSRGGMRLAAVAVAGALLVGFGVWKGGFLTPVEPVVAEAGLQPPVVAAPSVTPPAPAVVAAPAPPAQTVTPPAPQPVPAPPAPPVVASTPAVVAPVPEPLPKPTPPPIAEDMIRLPSVTATIGCTPGSEDCGTDESPVLQARVAAFEIDRTEVTAGSYALCLSAGACSPTRTGPGCVAPRAGEQLPVNCVAWAQADAFCKWRGARLPSEVEWERAARGSKGRLFPWGDDEATCDRAHMRSEEDEPGCDTGRLAAVDSKQRGRTAEGVADLAGNVWEWTADWYSQTRYETANPPRIGTERVVRGGSFENNGSRLRSHRRMHFNPSPGAANTGFRCVR